MGEASPGANVLGLSLIARIPSGQKACFMKHLYAILLFIGISLVTSAQVKIGTSNYTTLRSAFNAVSNGTHTGAVSILITGNTTETSDLVLYKTGTGGANYSSVTISPSGGAARTILLSGTLSSMVFFGASNVTIDGLNQNGNSLTIARSVINSTTIFIERGASNISIKRTTVLGSGSDGVIRVRTTALEGNTNATLISDCNIGPYNSNLPKYGINVQTDYEQVTQTTISNNNIYDFSSSTGSSYGIYIGKHSPSYVIENNRLFQTAARPGNQNYGIYVSNEEYIIGPPRYITGNIIGCSNSQGAGNYTLTSGKFVGIYYSVRKGTSIGYITDNTIKNIAMSGDSNGMKQNSPFKGIHLVTGETEVTGNVIGSMSAQNSISFTTTADADAEVIGIINLSDDNALIADNSIGGITANSATNSKMNITGIYAQDIHAGFAPSTFCTGNTIGGSVANSIQSTSNANGSAVIGIEHNNFSGWVRNNIVRNLSGSGAGFGDQVPVGVVGIKYVTQYGGGSSELSGNTVYNLINHNPDQISSVCGIFHNSAGQIVERNFIHTLAATSLNSGSWTEGLVGTGKTSELVNNIVVLGNTSIRGSNINGIRTLYFDGSGVNRIRNNSVYIGGAPVSGNGHSAALAVSLNYFAIPIDNNILINNRSNNGASGSNYSIALGSGLGKPKFRANVFHGTGNGYVLGILNGSPQATLAQWHSWSNPGYDFGYFDVPHFVDPTAPIPDLHINPNLPTVVEGNAFQAPAEDFDQQPRQASGDIGADEGSFMPLTAPVIQSVYVPQPACVGSGLYITITGTSMTGITQFKIGDVVYPISNNYDAGNGVGVLSASMSLAASGPITLANSEGWTVGQVITISPTPTISAHPQNITVCPSQVATFSVTSANAQSYQWRRNGVPISNGGAFSNVTTSTLTVSYPTELQAGTYDVVVTGGASACTTTSNPATLTIGSQSLLVAASGPTDLCAGQTVTLSPAMDTSALQFDGADDNFTFVNYSYFEYFTMSFWIRTDLAAPVGPSWQDGSGIIAGNNYGISQIGDKLAFGVNSLSPTAQPYTLLSTANINSGEWIHVAVTRRPDTGAVAIYLNGQLDSTGTVYPGMSFSPTDMRVGALMAGNNFFNGALDDIRIWHRQLANNEIQSIQIGGNISGTNLTHHYSFNEGSGSSIIDTATGLNTTLAGAPQWTSRIGEASFNNYFWSNGQNTRTITVTQSGDYSMYGYNDNCPNISNSIPVLIQDPEVQIEGSANFYCGSQPVVLEASGAQTYSWTSSDGLTQFDGPLLSVTPQATTIYTVTGTSANGCSSTAQYMVMVEPPVQLSIAASSTYITQGQSVELTASTGNGSYLWSPSAGLNSIYGPNVIATPSQTTTYTVSGSGCQVPQSVTIYVLPESSATDNALDFDGLNDFVSFPAHSANVEGSFAVAMWVKPLHPTKTMHLFSTRNGAQPNTFDIQLMDGNKIHGDIGHGTSWLTTSADAVFAYQPNVWMHIAYVIKPGMYQIYVNGNLIQSGNYPGTAVLFNSTNHVTLGASQGEDTYLRGVLDDLYIVDHDFPVEMMQHAPAGGLPASLRYLFDHGVAGGYNPSVTMLANMAPENYHGTLNNFALSGNFSNWVEGQSAMPQSISFEPLSNVEYGSGSFPLGGSATSGLPIAYFSTNPSVATVSGNIVTVVGVGTTTIEAQQDGNAFYNPAQPQFQELTVTPKSLTANAIAQNKVYDRNATAAITGTLSGIVGLDVVDLSGSATFASIDVGNGIAVTPALSITGADAYKYILTQPTGLSANISPKTLTTSGSVANGKIYDGTTSASISGTALAGVIAPDEVTIASNAGTFASALPGTDIPVTANMTLGGTSSGNYQLAQPTGLAADITTATASAVISGGGTNCNNSYSQVFVTVTGAPGPFNVTVAGGGFSTQIHQYYSGTPIFVAAQSTATFTITSISAPGTTFNVSGSATLIIQTLQAYYFDADADGFGDANVSILACEPPPGYVLNYADCDDADASLWQTGLFYTDADGDGYTIGELVNVCYGATVPIGYSVSLEGTDCDDTNAEIWQLGTFFVDADGDGFTTGQTVVVCYGLSIPNGFAAANIGIDCNDSIASVHPGAVEIFGNGIDDNCDGNLDEGGQITTQVVTAQCGTTLTVIGSLISAINVQNSTGYRFEVTNTTTGAVQVIDRPLQWFSLTMLGQYDYATTYSIRVQVQRNGVWTGYYGPACQVSSPAILDAGGAAQISASQCGITLATINTLIATNSIPNTTGYRFRVTNLTDPSAPNQVQTIDRTLHWFALTMLPTYTYGTTYLIEVAVKTNGEYSGYGSSCTISTPAVPTLISCGTTIASAGTLVSTVNRSNTTSYRFELTNLTTNIVTTIDRPVQWFKFNMVPGYTPNTEYGVRVALMTSGVYSLYGDACVITSPGVARQGDVKDTIKPFRVVAYPNPFAESFGIHMTTSGEQSVSVNVYDMTGRLLQANAVAAGEVENLKLGSGYPAGVYNVVVSQGENVATLRVVKR